MTIHVIVNLNKLIVRLFKQCMMIGINVGHRHIKITCFGVVSIHSYLIQQRPVEEVNYVQATANLTLPGHFNIIAVEMQLQKRKEEILQWTTTRGKKKLCLWESHEGICL